MLIFTFKKTPVDTSIKNPLFANIYWFSNLEMIFTSKSTFPFIFRYYENKHGFYDDLSDEEEDEDDIDDAGASVGNLSNRISTYPEIVLNSSQYQYYNSPRDLTLPLQKHKNVQHVLYESPEEGELLEQVIRDFKIKCNFFLCRNFTEKVFGCQREFDKPHN